MYTIMIYVIYAKTIGLLKNNIKMYLVEFVATQGMCLFEDMFLRR